MVSPYSSHQVIELELMTQEEYPEMLQDFTGFMLRKYIPRAYKNLPGTAGLQITPTVVLSTGMLAPFYSPQAQETFRILGEIGAGGCQSQRDNRPVSGPAGRHGVPLHDERHLRSPL